LRAAGRETPGQPVEATLNAYPDWKIPAEVIAIIPTADRSKATVKVRIKLNVKDARIVPDMGVRVSFLEVAPASSAPRPVGVRVPGGAVVDRDGQKIAFVVGDDHKAVRRVLTMGGKLGDDVQVLKGLEAGDSVVVEPPPSLAEGMPVKVATGDAGSP